MCIMDGPPPLPVAANRVKRLSEWIFDCVSMALTTTDHLLGRTLLVVARLLKGEGVVEEKRQTPVFCWQRIHYDGHIGIDTARKHAIRWTIKINIMIEI